MAIKISGTTVIDDSRDINNIGVITATGDIISSGNLGIGTITPTGTAALTNNEATLAVGIVTTNTVYGTTKIIAKQFSAHNPDGTNVATRDKYRLWDSSVYNIGMDNDMSFGGLNDYAMTFQVNSDSDRGFVFLDSSHTDSQGAMSLTTEGKMCVAHSLRIGYGESDTTTPGATYRLDVSGDVQADMVSITNGILEVKAEIAASHTLTSGYNAMAVDPTVNSGVTVTVPSGAVWAIV